MPKLYVFTAVIILCCMLSIWHWTGLTAELWCLVLYHRVPVFWLRLRYTGVTPVVSEVDTHTSLCIASRCLGSEVRLGWGGWWVGEAECCMPSICQCEHTKIWFKLQVCTIYTCYKSCHLRYPFTIYVGTWSTFHNINI